MNSHEVNERTITWTISVPLECFMCTEENIDNVILYPCQHVNCRKCINKILSSIPMSKKCPQCRGRIVSVVDFFSNSTYEPKASCPYEDCEKHGVEYSLIDLRKHINGECKYGFIKCKCNVSMRRSEHGKHLEVECPEVIEKCNLCGVLFRRKRLDHHVDNCCEYKLIPCPNKGCDNEILRKDMECHKSECEYRIEVCPTTNCNKQGEYCNIKNHISNCFEKICDLCGDIFPHTHEDEHDKKCLMVETKCPICYYDMTKRELISHMQCHMLNQMYNETDEKTDNKSNIYIKCFTSVTLGSLVGVMYNKNRYVAQVVDISYDPHRKIRLLLLGLSRVQKIHITITKGHHILYIEECIDEIAMGLNNSPYLLPDIHSLGDAEWLLSLISNKIQDVTNMNYVDKSDEYKIPEVD